MTFYIADFISKQGNVRKTMEDGFINKSFIVSQNMSCHVFGVLDGHGGDDVMRWLRQYIPFYVRETILKHNCNWTTMCLTMNQQLRLLGKKAGSTMSMVIVIANLQDNKYRMCLVNVGDSAIAGSTHCMNHPWKNRCRACLATHDRLTTSHDLKNPEERQRFQKQHKLKLVEKEYITNGHAMLNMTRAFGDFELGDFIQPIPEVVYVKKPLCFITLASDGIWDVLTPREIANASQQECKVSDSGELNACLISKRELEPEHDNYTMGVLFFDTSKFTPWVQ